MKFSTPARMPASSLDRYFSHIEPVTAASPVCSVLVDAEEDFDWLRPARGVAYDVRSMRALSDFQAILAAYGAIPTYLLTYPVMQDAGIVAALRARIARGRCQAGIQLHPWVTPPFTEVPDIRNSFAGNLPAELEEQKLAELIRLFRSCFGEDPKIFRAGRYGLGQYTPALLEHYGFQVDTSLAPHTSLAGESGPDFSATGYQTFWFGQQRRLLELPLCRSIAGWGGQTAAGAYRKLTAGASPLRYLPGILAWTRCAERITLSPEGNDVTAAGRLVHSLLRHRQNVLALSLHSSSLIAGQNPYVRSKADLHLFYDQLSAILDMLSGKFAVRFVPALELPAMLAGGLHG